MKICYLANSAIPSSTASSIQIVKMCEAFSQLDNEVTLITANTKIIDRDIFDFYNEKKKFRITKLKKFNTFPLGIKYYLFSLFSIFESFKYKPDIYITRNFFSCFLLTLFKKKTIIELHHDLTIESRIVRFLIKDLKFLKSKYIKLAIAITKGVKKEYVSNNYIDNHKINILPSGSSLIIKKKKSLKKKSFKIGYFGSLYRSRGLELIQKLARIDKKNSYHVYGNLSMLNYKKYKTSIPNLHYSNYVPYKVITKHMCDMDILIIPYVSTITVAGDVGDITKFTSPLKLFDYLAAGKMIMCSDFKVLREIVDMRNVIFIKNYKNPFSWKMEIRKISHQSQKQLIMAHNNNKLSKNYTLKRRAKKIIELIN